MDNESMSIEQTQRYLENRENGKCKFKCDGFYREIEPANDKRLAIMGKCEHEYSTEQEKQVEKWESCHHKKQCKDVDECLSKLRYTEIDKGFFKATGKHLHEHPTMNKVAKSFLKRVGS